MAGVLKLHCIQPLRANPGRRQHEPGITRTPLSPAARIILSGRFSTRFRPSSRELQQSSCLLWHGRTTKRPALQEPNFTSLRVFAKGNVRQRQKKAAAPPRTPENGVGIPPTPVSAPSLTELPSQEEKVRVLDVIPLKSIGEKLVSGSEGENVEARDAPVAAERNEPAGSLGILSWGLFPRLGRQILRRLSSLPLAIGELLVIAALSALGTIIEQNESPRFYFESYPEENPMFGFLTWRVILGGSLDHIYSSWYFLGLLVLLASSLVACSTTRQFPIVKVARRWSFLKSTLAFQKLPLSETLEKAKLCDFATLLMAEGFQVFVRGPALYAFKGLAGRYAPIGVHIALLLIMGGATISAIGGYHGTVMVPQGLAFQVGDVLAPKGFLSVPSPVMNAQVKINKFFIDYLDNGMVSQFHSDISIMDLRDKEVYRKTIAVNDPLRYNGVTMYQTDWAISAIQVRVDGSEPFNLVMASLETGDKKLFGTFLPLGAEGLEKARGISILARDLQSVVIYDQEGKFVGVRRPGSGTPISVDGVSIVVDDLIGSSGLELKMDPGVPAVYTGFGALMLTTCISYLSHSQVWALQNGTSLVVGGKSNRAKVEFELQLSKILDLVPAVTIISGTEPHLVTGSSRGDIPAAPVEEETSRQEEVQIGYLVCHNWLLLGGDGGGCSFLPMISDMPLVDELLDRWKEFTVGSIPEDLSSMHA